MKELIVLAPDKNVRFGIEELLCRYESFDIKQISYEIFIHPYHDPGICSDAANFLRPFSNQYSYALVFLDYEGSGQEDKDPEDVVYEIKSQIEKNGWLKRVEVILFNPEFEIWVWAESPHMSNAVGWADYQSLKNWLIGQKLWKDSEPKPHTPKGALEAALRYQHIPRSSSVYQEIARHVGINKCQDASFKRLKSILQQWFPK